MAYKQLNRINRRMELIWFHVMEKAFSGDARRAGHSGTGRLIPPLNRNSACVSLLLLLTVSNEDYVEMDSSRQQQLDEIVPAEIKTTTTNQFDAGRPFQISSRLWYKWYKNPIKRNRFKIKAQLGSAMQFRQQQLLTV